MKPPPKPSDASQSVQPQSPEIHVVIDPTRIASVKIKYFIAGLLNSGISEEDITGALDWAEGLMEMDAKQFSDNEVVMRLAMRF